MGFWSFMALGAVLLVGLEAYRTYVRSKVGRGSDIAKLEKLGKLEERI